MLFQRLNQTDPERVFIIARNNEGAAMVAGQAVQWELASASIDGVRVRDMDTGNLWAFTGLCDAALADGEYGLIQVYGYRSTSVIFQTGTSMDTGLALVPVAGQDYLSSVATAFVSTDSFSINNIVAVLAESVASSSASATISKKLFLRAL